MRVVVQVIFPDEINAEKFMGWMSDGGGEELMLQAVEDALSDEVTNPVTQSKYDWEERTIEFT